MSAYENSPCPIAFGLDRFGDRWSLLIVRHALAGSRRFGDFQRMPEQIPTNILTNRLKRLVEEGILRRELYQQRPPRYEYRLTQKGADLLPVLQAVVNWGRRHSPCTAQPPDWFTKGKPEDFAAD